MKMALVLSVNMPNFHSFKSPNSTSPKLHSNRIPGYNIRTTTHRRRRILSVVNGSDSDSGETTAQNESDGEIDNLGVKAALSMLRFYKREISPLLPTSCRYVPTCSEYSVIAYKKYGVAKGTILTAWRLCRCNPLGGSGFDPPRWFDETSPPED